MFLINSRFPHFSAATHNAHRTRGDCRTWPPFSRSYGGILPSSLTIVHPNALVSSTRPPVSVSGTGRAHTSLEAFLDSTGTSNIPNNLGTHHASPLYAERIYLSYGPHAYTTIHSVALTTNLCHPIAWLPTIKIPRTTHQTNTKSIDPVVVGG